MGTVGTSAILKLYRKGMSFEKIGKLIGISDQGVRYRLRHYDLHSITSEVLLLRITQARTRRQKNHAIAMLWRHRPKLYARFLEERMPALRGIERYGQQWKGICPKCLTHNAYVTGKPDAWRWRCSSCEETGYAARTKPNDTQLEESGS